MSLRENLSRLSPNEFLEKIQDMFQMYQESQEDYYEEGLKDLKRIGEKDDIFKYKIDDLKQDFLRIERFLKPIFGALANKGLNNLANPQFREILDKPIIDTMIGSKSIKLSIMDFCFIVKNFTLNTQSKMIIDRLNLRAALKQNSSDNKYDSTLKDEPKNPNRLPK